MRRQAPMNWHNTSNCQNSKKRRRRPARRRIRMIDVNRRMQNSVVVPNRTAGSISGGCQILLMLPIFATIAATAFAGQSAQVPAEKNSAIEAHFSAAQQAQHNEDYATAEREYVAVLALAPEFAEVHRKLCLGTDVDNSST